MTVNDSEPFRFAGVVYDVPKFQCEKCGMGVGAQRTGDAPWEPSPCYWCKVKQLRRDAARRRRQHPRTLAGVNIDRAVKGLRQLPVLKELLGRKRIQVDVGHIAEGGCGGRAFIRRRKIRVYGGPTATPGRVLEVVLHELCHMATPDDRAHGERFRRVFQRAVREAWDLCIPYEMPRGHHANQSYAIGELVTMALDSAIAGEGGAWFDTYPDVKP